MDKLNYISMSLDLFCIVISFIIFISLLLESERKSKLNRLFRVFVLCNIGIVLSDLIAWLMTGNLELYAYFLIRAANYFHYLFGAFILAALSLYMLAFIALKEKTPNLIKYTVIILCATQVLLTTVSQFTNMYYLIDENNVYHRQGLYWLSQIFPAAGLIINMGIIIFYRKVLKTRTMLFFLTYMILPVVAILIQSLFYGITLVNIAATLTMLILYIGVQIEQSKDMESHILLINRQLELQREHYKMLQTHITETKKAKHDLRHHLTVFQSFINAGETEKLTAYVNDYKASLPDDTEVDFCKNYAVNAILRYYSIIAKNEDIKITAHLDLPENTGIADSDLCIIFGNCIENAIEACRKINDGRFIKINSKVAGKMLAVTIDNSFDGVLKKEGSEFLSRKHEGQGAYPVSGIGISSVKSVAKKYGGETRFEVKDNIFQVSILLRLKLYDIITGGH
ncbi:MAG: GHKL domain-containing protein [Treponema sp.]|jgi:hypothetical protein|nr:GHKL domain-containing protein [Treponema sp.]